MVAQLCPEDPDIRRELESLLNARERAGNFLSRTTSLSTLRSWPPSRIWSGAQLVRMRSSMKSVSAPWGWFTGPATAGWVASWR